MFHHLRGVAGPFLDESVSRIRNVTLGGADRSLVQHTSHYCCSCAYVCVHVCTRETVIVLSLFRFC